MTEPTQRRRQGVSLGTAVGLLVIAAGVYIGMRPLGDNSFLTHLATGRLILDSGGVPSTDPYSFTAPDAPWVVQSWLASVAYAWTEELGGAGAIRALMGLVAGGLALCGWMLGRDAQGIVPRLALTAAFVAVGAGFWSERPVLFGLLFLAIALLTVERSWPVWPLIPLFWLWANTHGSFPIGVGLLAVVAVGAHLDREDVRRVLRALGAAALGALLGMIGPLGLQALVFPLDLVGRQEVLQNVVEWRAPMFQSGPERVFLLMLLVAVVLLVRRPRWRDGLPLVVFTALALTASRNVAVASIVLLPGMARGLGDLGSLRASVRGVQAHGFAIVGVAALVLVPLARLDQDDYRLASRYPVIGLAHVERLGIDLTEVRMAAPDGVGNLIDLLHRPRGVTFFDDRFDMFPEALFEDHRVLLDGDPEWRTVLARHDIDLVLWHRDGVGTVLAASPQWRQLLVEPDFALYCRRGAALASGVRC